MKTTLPSIHHWTAKEALIVFDFLEDLKEFIWLSYEDELVEICQAEVMQQSMQEAPCDFEIDDEIQF